MNKKKLLWVISALIFSCLLTLVAKQEIIQSHQALSEIESLRGENYIIATGEANDIIRANFSTGVSYLTKNLITERLVDLVKKNQIIIKIKKGQSKTIWDANGDFGTVWADYQTGDQIFYPSPEEEKEYFRQNIPGHYNYLCANFWNMIFYYLGQLILILIISLLPIAIVLKLTLIITILLLLGITIITVLKQPGVSSIAKTTIIKELVIQKKIPPGPTSFDFHLDWLPAVNNYLKIQPDYLIEPVIILSTQPPQKIPKKIEHIPNF
jgi:hypothetical protein